MRLELIGTRLRQTVNLLQVGRDRVVDAEIELIFLAQQAQVIEHGGGRQRIAIGTVLRQRLEYVGRPQNPGLERNLVPGQAERIALAVGHFMMIGSP